MDKFGHHIHKQLRSLDFLDFYSRILLKTDKGDFDLHSTKLTGITSPLNAEDAVNKDYVDKIVQSFVNKQDVHIALELMKKEITSTVDKLKAEYYTKDEVNGFLKSILKNEQTTTSGRNS